MIPRAYFGGVSLQTVESVFRVSRDTGKPAGLMFTENQCGHLGGYVSRYDEMLSTLARLDIEYGGHRVVLARDHIRFDSLERSAIEDVEELCFRYLKDGFSALHLDLDVVDTDPLERLYVGRRLVGRIRERAPASIIELSLCRDDDIFNLKTIALNIDKIIEVRPDLIVLPTGSRVLNGIQIGKFCRDEVREVVQLLKKHSILVKEHNADFLSRTQIQKRSGLVDSFNVAPELGNRQSALTLLLASSAGLDPTIFLSQASNDPNSMRWVDSAHSAPHRVSEICGHYVFNQSGYASLCLELEATMSFQDALAAILDIVVRRYLIYPQ